MALTSDIDDVAHSPRPEPDAGMAPALASILALVTDVFDVSGAFVSLGKGARTPLVRHGGPIPGKDALSFAADVMAARAPLFVADARSHLRMMATRLPPVPSEARFYAGTPLFDGQGTCFGALCLLDKTPRAAFKSRRKRQLSRFGETIGGMIRTHRSAWEQNRKAETDNRLAGQRLRDVIEAVNEGIALFDADDLPILCNSRYARWCNGEIDPTDCGSRPVVRDVCTVGGLSVAMEERSTTEGGTIAIGTKLGKADGDADFFRSAFQAAAAPMYVVRDDGQAFLAANDAALALYGYRRDAFLSLQPETIGAAGTAAGSGTARHRRAGGDSILVETLISPFTHAGRAAVLVVLADITRQRRREQDLQARHALLETVLDELPVSIFVKDTHDESRFVVFNRACGVLHKVDPRAMVGKTVHDLFPKEAADNIQAEDVAILRAGQRGETRSAEFVTDGKIFQTKIVSILDIDQQKNRYIAGITEEFTDIFEKLNTFKLLFEKNPQPMYVFDVESARFQAVNDAAVEFYGYSRDHFLTLTLFDIRPASEHELLRQSIDSQDDKASQSRLWIHRKADGSTAQVRIHRKTMEHGGRHSLLSVVIDLTEQKIVESELKRTRAFLENVVNLIPTPIFVKDVRDDFRYLLANHAMRESCSPPRTFRDFDGDFVQKSDFDIFAREVADAYRERDETAVRNGEVLFSGQSTLLDAAGQQRFMRVKLLPVSEADDPGIKYLVGITEDITDLKQREESLRLLFEANPLPMYAMDLETGFIIAVNEAAVAFYGFGREHFLTLKVSDLLVPGRSGGDRSDGIDWDTTAQACVWRHRKSDGGEVPVSIYWKYARYSFRNVVMVAAIDVTEREFAESELRRTRAFLDRVIESIPAAVFAKDMNDHGRYVLINKAHQDLIGREYDEIIGLTDHDIFRFEEAEAFVAQDRRVIDSGLLEMVREEPVTLPSGEVRVITTKKLPVVDRSGQRPRFVVGISEDITARRQIEAKIAHMAHHDALTGLPNRVLFHERLEGTFAHAASHQERFAVLVFDLDKFKSVNDTLGHPMGDALLKAVADRLQACMRPTDTPARLGGDEFAILQTPVAGPNDTIRLASRLLGLLNEPYEIGGQHLIVGVTVGIAMGMVHGDNPDNLLQNADIALYRAKTERRGTFRLFEAEMNAKLQKRRILEMDLRHALVQSEFEVHYQPLIDLKTNRISGCEALVRWRHPERGLVPPSDFIPLAEEIGLIGPLGDWVLRQACAEAARWPAHVKIAVNLSSVQFTHRDLTASIVSALAASGLPATRLDLEITESVLLADNETNMSTLRQLHMLGVSISLDDFGTGYSALGYLRSFPFNKIKIDRSFVKDLGVNSGCLAIIRAVTGLGANLGMRTVAEGVETEAQLEQVRAEGCDEGQGYLFSRPRPAAEIHQLITAGKSFERAA